MDEIKVTNYSLIALLVITFAAFLYTCSVVNINSNISTDNSKVIAGFKA